MKTAVIYSGQARTVSHLDANHWFFVLRKLPDPTIFVSVADDARADDMLCLKREGVPFFMEKVTQPSIAPPVQRPHHFGYPVTSRNGPEGVLRQLWALNRAWEFVGERAEEFDVFVRIRPDIHFCRFIPPLFTAMYDYSCLTPWHARWGGINDRLAVMGRKAAQAYFTAFSKREEMFRIGCPCHTETMMGTALELGSITPSHSLATEFTILGDDLKWKQENMSIVEVAEYARTRP